MLKAPFEIGDVYWRPAGIAQQERVECPMCCGNKYITATIGTGETYELECDTCMAGYLGAQGYINQYVPAPKAEKFVIDKLHQWCEDGWRVADPSGRIADFTALYATEEAALAVDAQWAVDLEERNMASLRRKKYGRVSSWSIQYHRKQIKEYERKIAWHQQKLHEKQED